MHNTHYIIVTGEDFNDARYGAESELEEWGNANNWFDIRRIIDMSASNDNPSDIEYLQAVADELNKSSSTDRKQAVIEQIERLQEQVSDGGRYIYWQLADCYRELYNIAGVVNPFTVENLRDNSCDEFNSFTYDEFGITSFAQSVSENEKLFLIEVDMHS